MPFRSSSQSLARSALGLAIAVVLVLAVGSAAGVAQDEQSDGELTARIYEGTCDAPSPPAVTTFTPATPEAGGLPDQAAYSLSARTDQPLADLLEAERAIVVERTDGELLTTVACGEFAGEAGSDRLVIGLFGEQAKQLTGVAVASHYEEGTAIAIFLFLGSDGGEVQPVDPPQEEDGDEDGALDEPQEPVEGQDEVEGGV